MRPVAYARIVPLGGVGEIGMNCLAIETDEGILVVDCGVMFPHEDYGVDVIHPDFSYLWDRREEVLGVVVTHGHEDHIGGLPYLLRRIPVPVWAPPYALGLIRARLSEHPEVPVPDLRPTAPRERFEVGPFSVEPLRITHSIPDATALAIDTPAGLVFHTGDFKLEDNPMDGEVSDEERFHELGEQGVAVLLSDSTGADVPGRVGGERQVARALRDLISTMQGRVFVGLFASNVYRLQALADAALETGRRLCFVGRSVRTHARAGMDLGRLRVRGEILVSPENAMALPPRELLAVVSGTQAEPAGALARLARGDHPRLKAERGDTVVFSSRAIPGNERAIFEMICQLERRGVDVHFPQIESEIHVSGHGGREEQARMIGLLRPRAFVPIHGTYHHLKRHAELASSLGVDRVLIVEDGQSARLEGGDLTPSEPVPHGRVAVSASIDIPEETIAERVTMGRAGAVFASIALDASGLLAEPPVVVARGVLLDDAPEVVREAAHIAIDEALRIAKGPLDVLPPEQAREAVRRALRRIYTVGESRPLITVEVKREGAAD